MLSGVPAERETGVHLDTRPLTWCCKLHEHRVTHLLATVGNGYRTASLDAMEEPFLNRIVVERPVNVDRAHASEGNTLVGQQLLSVQFALQSPFS